MSEFWFLHWLDVPGGPVAHGIYDAELGPLLAEPGTVEDWQPLELDLEDQVSTDYLANDIGIRLCSPRLRAVLDSKRGAKDQLQWLAALVRDRQGAREYSILHFPDLPDVLDPQRTIKARGWFVVKPVIALNSTDGHTVFSFAGAKTRVIVSDTVRRAIIEAECSGVDFSPITAVGSPIG